ncbi:hypothetical protein BofuT4_uP027960.1 [Botrytis cinerea T4]|uniref:Uncharacterized protein n=1 Tax=Botryotinia fuckeliana (strain T4) TaxID=999810 RepID=G2YA49_BOTF4|nr:hypothetical protein BofuT4_uP027960.1 [Botrytis cinerea T4]
MTGSDGTAHYEYVISKATVIFARENSCPQRTIWRKYNPLRSPTITPYTNFRRKAAASPSRRYGSSTFSIFGFKSEWYGKEVLLLLDSYE